jgi:hypothetical protein
MSERRPAARPAKAAKPATPLTNADVRAASPYGYAFTDWLAREDPAYVRARQPLSELSFGEGKELSVNHGISFGSEVAALYWQGRRRHLMAPRARGGG